MAEPRKPLIDPDALPSSSISRIIQRDRAASGRETQEAADPPNLVLSEAVTEQLPDQLTSKPVSQQAAEPDPVLKPVEAKVYGSKKELRKAIEEMAATPLVTVSLKLPDGLNDWLDTYAFAHRKTGVKKQDLIARAVQLLILDAAEGSSKAD